MPPSSSTSGPRRPKSLAEAAAKVKADEDTKAKEAATPATTPTPAGGSGGPETAGSTARRTGRRTPGQGKSEEAKGGKQDDEGDAQMEQTADKGADERYKQDIEAWDRSRPELGDREESDPAYKEEILAWYARGPTKPSTPPTKQRRTEEQSSG